MWFVIRSHNDVANNLYLLENNQLSSFNFTDLTGNAKWTNVSNEYQSHTDLIRLIEGKVRGQFWSAYVDCASPNAVGRTLEQIDVIKRLIDQNNEHMEFVTESEGNIFVKLGRWIFFCKLFLSGIWNAFYHNKVGSLIGSYLKIKMLRFLGSLSNLFFFSI